MPVEARNFRQYDRDLGLNGVIAPMGFGITLNLVTLTASRATWGRFVPSRTFSATVIAHSVSVAASADDACDVGIYSGDLTTKLVSSGATTGKLNSQGLKTISIAATTLQAGVTYYAAFSCGTFGGTAAQLTAASTAASSGAADFFGTANGTRLMAFQASAHPLATPVVVAGAPASMPLLAIRES